MSAASSIPDRRLTIAAVEARTGRERSTISRWCKAGRFPRPSYIMGRRCWRESEIVAWEAQAAAGEPDPARFSAAFAVRARTREAAAASKTDAPVPTALVG